MKRFVIWVTVGLVVAATITQWPRLKEPSRQVLHEKREEMYSHSGNPDVAEDGDPL